MTDSVLHYISMGVLLGLSAGVSPGPILTLVLSQTLKHDAKEGMKVAISPLITDFPIILFALFIFNQIAKYDLILAVFSFAGGLYIAYLGIESLRINDLNFDTQGVKSGSIKKGVIANFLNPSPYLFWGTVGTPIIFKALNINVLTAVLFLLSFYLLLVGSKVLIAYMVAKTKVFINQKAYVLIMRILGIALVLFSLLFFYDGMKYFEWN